MAKKSNAAKESNKTVAPVAEAVDNVVTTNQEAAAVIEEVKVPTKAEQAQAIFVEEAAAGDDKLRARVIKRFKDELGMGDAGASTYFQNAKKKAAGEKVKHYYKPKSAKPGNEPTNDVNEDAQLFNVKKANGAVESFMKMEDAQECIDANGGELITEEEAAQLVA